MKTALRIFFIVMIGFCLMMGTGWAKGEMRKSGFLTDYSQLSQDDPLKSADWLYINKNVVFGAYDKIILKHVSFFLKPDAEYNGIQADEMNELADACHEAIFGALSDVYAFTDETGPGVMVLRIAITDLVPNKPGKGTVSSIMPVGIVVSGAKKLTTGTHIGMGGVSFEAELLDSQTNEVLMAVVDSKSGKKYKIRKSTSTWGHAKDIFKQCAKTLRKRLDKLSGRR
ncbi:MAG: DUF3313 domain-containing protein [Deltaproteobacteria bacterium]|nr:DUF3313 domain-containing protein [Deltaproteobacteria bacterium]